MSFVKEAYKWVSSYKNDNKSVMPQILEPFSTLLKLAILSYKPDGTKIAVYDNKLYIQDACVSQGIIRYAWGNNREEVHFLLKPMMRCVELYPCNQSDELKLIYTQAINGLKKLKNSYKNESSTVCYTIDLYIQIIQNSLADASVHIHSYEISQNLNELTLSCNTKMNLEKIFEGIWTENDIVLVSNLFNSVNTESACRSSYLKSIENIIKAKEGLIMQKIRKVSNII